MIENISADRSLTATSPEINRRGAVRFQCLRVISCIVRASRERIWGRVRDVSTTGMGFIVPKQVEPGTELEIELKSAVLLPEWHLRGRVIHATPRASGSWQIGCQFHEPLTDEQVRSLL
jgi:hypothetical protein